MKVQFVPGPIGNRDYTNIFNAILRYYDNEVADDTTEEIGFIKWVAKHGGEVYSVPPDGPNKFNDWFLEISDEDLVILKLKYPI